MSAPSRPVVDVDPSWRFPAAETRTLANGLRVHHLRHAGALAAATLVLDLPSHVEPRAEEGVVALLARLLDKGSTFRDADAIAATAERRGLQYLIRTGHDAVYADLEFVPRMLPEVLDLLAEIVSVPVFPDDQVRGEIEGLRAEYRMAMDIPAARAGLELAAAGVAPEARCARPAGGTEESLARLGRAPVADLHRKYVGPANVTLVLAGEFSAEAVFAAADSAFGAWSAPAEEVAPASAPPVRAPSTVVIHRPGSVQSHLAFGAAAIDRRSPDWPALLAAVHALGGGMSSRLMAELRTARAYTYGVRASLRPWRRGGMFVIETAVDTSVTGAAVNETLRLLAEYAAAGPTAAERNDAVDYLLGSDAVRHQNAQAVAGAHAALVGNDLPAGHLDEVRSRLAVLTPEDLAEAFTRHVPSALSLVVVGDADTVARHLPGPLIIS
ncbi:M16 family metallopeptidase [Amycolatopsis jejuensis]|uniref:M16 family metallopeptidase n=1 Tax=Amycolatopsis jejuensis TaxID=330084 RepID=UPI0005251C99|nr:pitrilysin family protein [Amycolatopsis jejuensis]